MSIEEFIIYLQNRIECTQAYLRDLYTAGIHGVDVVKAETELDVLLGILNELKD